MTGSKPEVHEKMSQEKGTSEENQGMLVLESGTEIILSQV